MPALLTLFWLSLCLFSLSAYAERIVFEAPPASVAARPAHSHAQQRTISHIPAFQRNNQPVKEIELVAGSPLLLHLDYAEKDKVHYQHYAVRASDPRIKVRQHYEKNSSSQTIVLRADEPIEGPIWLWAYANPDDDHPDDRIPPVALSVVERLTLPPEETEEGLIIRLLLNEVPGNAAYEENRRAMRMMKQVLDTRLTASKYNTLIGRGINNGCTVTSYSDVIFAPGQFDGFATGTIDSRLRRRITERLRAANTSSGPYTAHYRWLILHAQQLANEATVDCGGIDAETLTHWRTDKHRSPANTVKRETVAGNTFYSLSPIYIKQNKGKP